MKLKARKARVGDNSGENGMDRLAPLMKIIEEEIRTELEIIRTEDPYGTGNIHSIEQFNPQITASLKKEPKPAPPLATMMMVAPLPEQNEKLWILKQCLAYVCDQDLVLIYTRINRFIRARAIS